MGSSGPQAPDPNDPQREGPRLSRVTLRDEHAPSASQAAPIRWSDSGRIKAIHPWVRSSASSGHGSGQHLSHADDRDWSPQSRNKRGASAWRLRRAGIRWGVLPTVPTTLAGRRRPRTEGPRLTACAPRHRPRRHPSAGSTCHHPRYISCRRGSRHRLGSRRARSGSMRRPGRTPRPPTADRFPLHSCSG